jgi:hypothetical protein
MDRFYLKNVLSALLIKLSIVLSAMQRDIRQENPINTLTISEGQEMYLKFFIQHLFIMKS